jgi:hypothetical protein
MGGKGGACGCEFSFHADVFIWSPHRLYCLPTQSLLPDELDETTLDMALVTLTNLVQDDTDNVHRLSTVRPFIPTLLTQLLLQAAATDHPTNERLCIHMMALSALCATDPGAQAAAAAAGACEALVLLLRGLVAAGTEEGAGNVIRQGCVHLREMEMYGVLTRHT